MKSKTVAIHILAGTLFKFVPICIWSTFIYPESI